MKLPFSFLPVSSDAAFPSRLELKGPILALFLENGNNRVIVYAVVDSGADVCVFPASVARDLKLSLQKDKVSAFSGFGETTQIAYFEQIQATILPMESAEIGADQEPISFPLYAGFCETLEHVGMGLLGQEGFFSRFKVNFHNSQNFFEIV